MAAARGNVDVLNYLEYVHEFDREFKNNGKKNALYYTMIKNRYKVINYLTCDAGGLIDNIKTVISAYESEDKKRIKELEDTVEEMSSRI